MDELPPEGITLKAVENYFNYFTEIEERFRRSRRTPSLLSTLDWALIESWKEAGIPLEAVMTGIERSFEKFARHANRFRKINGLAYCAQEVLRAAEEIRTCEVHGRPAGRTPSQGADLPFRPEEILKYFGRNRAALESAVQAAREKGLEVLADDLSDAALALTDLGTRQAAAPAEDFEDLERRLTALEEKVSAALTRATPVAQLANFREEVDKGLRIDRRKMTAAQIESLERQYLKKRLFEQYRVPRLSLFYL